MCQLTAAQLLCKFQKLSAVLLVASPERYRWKSFRAGKASALARAGHPFPQILQAGEWRSAAVLNHVDHDVLDMAAFLHVMSDGEEE